MAREIKTRVIVCRFHNDDGSEIAVPEAPNFYNDYFFSHDLGGVVDYYSDTGFELIRVPVYHPEVVTNSERDIVGQTFGWFDIVCKPDMVYVLDRAHGLQFFKLTPCQPLAGRIL